MNLPRFGVRYPVTTTMIFMAMILLGVVSLYRLGLDLMPKIEMPSISVVTTYEGAGPEEVESQVTKILEDRLATVRNLDKIECSSEEEVSVITLKFDWGTNLDEAVNDVRDKVDMTGDYLSEDVDRPVIFKYDVSMTPILLLAVTAQRSYPVLRDLIDEGVSDPLKTIPGVAAAFIQGGLERQISVELDRSRMEAYNISPEQVINALEKENLNIPGGHLKTGMKDYLIRTPGEIEIEEIRRVIVATTGKGRFIYLQDVAEVKDAFKEVTKGIEIDKKTGLIIEIQKQSGANTVQVAERVLQKLERLKEKLPEDVKIVVVRNSSDFIKNALAELRSSLYWGGILVLLVIIFFLRNLKAGLIIACSIPSSLIIAFFLLYVGGYTLNILSVSSLTIAVGMVVDAAIVVLDSIHRHREAGARPQEAAIFGAAEVSKAINASTLTTVAIFVPIVFVGGLAGIMFKEMAYVITVTLMASLFTALTIVPMLSSKFLDLTKPPGGKGVINKLSLLSESWLNTWDREYKNLLQWSLLHRKRVILGGGTIFFLSLLLLPFVGTRFMPEVDSSTFNATVDLPVDSRVEETGEVITAIGEQISREVPEIKVMYTMWGYSSGSKTSTFSGEEGAHKGVVGVRLIPKDKRRRSVQEILDRLRLLSRDYPGAEIRFNTEDPFLSMLFTEGKPFVLEIYGHDLDAGRKLAEEISAQLGQIKGIVDIEISRQTGKPQLDIEVDRDKASRLGLNIYQIGKTIQTFFRGKDAGKYREGGKEYDIFVRLRSDDRQNIEDLKNGFVVTPSQNQIRLNNIAEIKERFGPVKIERKNQERIIKLTANLSGRDLGSAVAEAKQRLAKVGLPPGFSVDFGGESEEQRKAFGLLALAMILGIILVYMVMAAQFESFRDPFIILFTIPFAIVGVILAHVIFRQVFNTYSFIGVIMLVGIVVNNAIVLISYINILRDRGLSVQEAVTQGGMVRLRPVLMTTVTTLFGLLPLAFSRGEGSEEWVSMGLTVLGGLLVSTVITLVFVPTLYSIFEERKFRAIGKEITKVIGEKL